MDDIVRQQTSLAQQKWLKSWEKGPEKTRWESPPIQYGDTCPDLELADLDGRERSLRSFWSKKPCLLMFLRHFGCSATMNRLKALKETWSELEKLGVGVVAIVQAEPERTAWFASNQQVPEGVEFLCDPDRAAYHAFGLLEGHPHQVLFRFPENVVRVEKQAGEKIAEERALAGAPLVDSPWQMPGDFLIDQKGVIRLVCRGSHIYQIPELAEIQAALMAIPG